MKVKKTSKPIKMRLFVEHNRDKLTRDVEEFINLPEVRLIDIQFSMGYSDLIEDIICAYTVYYREHTEDDEPLTSDILQ